METIAMIRALVCLVVLSTAARGFAQETLLGLPVPHDSAKPGAIVLHGGGRVTDDVFDKFVKLAGGKDARIVFVPNAGFREADYDSNEEFLEALSRRYGSWSALEREGRVASFRFLYTDNTVDADSEEFTAPLETATGVWFSGGSQLRLNYRYVGVHPQTTRFQDLLADVVSRGGVVGGTSAGTAAIPEIMTLWSSAEYDGAPQTAVAAHGFGLLKGAIVEQHFDSRGGRLERFCRLLRDSKRLDTLSGRPGTGNQMIGLGVEEPAALIIRGDHLEVAGNGSVHIFLKSNGGRSLLWHELAPMETAQLQRSPTRPPELVREETVLAK